jgi:hypothetical protein
MKLSTEDAASKARHRFWLDSLDARLVAAAFRFSAKRSSEEKPRCQESAKTQTVWRDSSRFLCFSPKSGKKRIQTGP